MGFRVLGFVVLGFTIPESTKHRDMKGIEHRESKSTYEFDDFN